jgi:ABC-2 type transport system ATP-binding protein
METILEVKELKKSYGKNAALKCVTFSVQSGTCFGLLGPNGAGKSTTMKILTGIVDADSGEARILGQDAAKHQNALRYQVGYVPQAITLYEKLSARDNLVFFGEMYGVQGKKLNQRIREVLTQTGLQSRENEAVEKFSGGMKRRINIAAALLHKPKLLILDEPTVGIDPQSRNHIFEMIRTLKAEGVTIIYSTHYMEEVEALCDDVAIIDRGKVITQGALSELLRQFSKPAIYVESDDFSQIPKYPGTKKTTKKDRGYVVEVDSVTEGMQHILESATENGIELQALEMMRPSLESVFLLLTGSSLRD